MEGNSLTSFRKTKKSRVNSATEYDLDSNAALVKDNAITKTKKKKRERDHGLETKVKVKIEEDSDSSFIHDITHMHLKTESSDDVHSKEIKTENTFENNAYNDDYAFDIANDGYKKKKKKKREEFETSESSYNGNFNDVETMSIDEQEIQVKIEPKTDGEIEDYNSQNSYDHDEQKALSIKKKKKKKEKMDELNRNANGNLVKIKVENELQYTNSQLSDTDYLTNNNDSSIKKKKKKKHKDKTENALSDDVSALETEIKVKVEVKSEVTDSDIEIKNAINNQESSAYSSTELHVKKKKKKRKHSEYDEVNDHLQIDDSIIKTEKINSRTVEDENDIDVEHYETKKKKKKNKHKEAIENEAEIDSVIEKKNYIEEDDNLESAEKIKKKKKKHKKHSDSSEVDVTTKEMDIKNTELIETQKKKKKKKKHSEELIHEEPEPTDLDIDYVASYPTDTQEDHLDSQSCKKKKKKKKHKCQKESSEVENATDCDSPEARYKKMEKILQEETDMKDETNKQPSESSGFESDEDDYSESERIPRITKPKPSIFTKYPKLARLIQDSDSDDNYPHLQHQKLTLKDALKLSTLKIQLRHEPLPQHQVEKYPGTATLTLKEKKLFTEYCPIKRGRFDYDEDQRIVHNWKKFCKTHEWKRSNIYPFLHQRKKGFFYATSVEDRKKFVQFLAKGLPHRTLYSVYTRFRNLYATHKTSRYTKEEDEIIKNEVKGSNGRNQFSALARKLNRTRASVWRRYKLLQSKENSLIDSDIEIEGTNTSTIKKSKKIKQEQS